MRVIKPFDPWKSPLCLCPKKYTLNPYSGCGFKCLYCYITSYVADAFSPRPKDNIIKLLKRDLENFDGKLRVAIAYSTDPYTHLENKYKITRKILEILMKYNVEVLIATKSTLVIRDIDILSKMRAVVSITITTLEEDISRILEPEAPPPQARIKALERLNEAGIKTSIRIDPIIPYLTDDPRMIRRLIDEAYSTGVRHVVSSIYKAKPDSFKRLIECFPNIKEDLERLYKKYGIWMYGYLYPPYSYRYRILKSIKDHVSKYNLDFNTCREGMRYLDSQRSYCDASHLL